MIVLLVVGLLAGLVTGISPCILPVVPVVFAAGTLGAGGDDGANRAFRKPLALVAGLVVSFSVFTLVGSWLLGALGLPQDLLRNVGLVVLALVAVGLIVPPVGEALGRPFARLAKGRVRAEGGGFVLGLSLGLLYVPCAGPVLAAITVVSASHRIDAGAIALTAAFAIGVAIPLLGFAFAGRNLLGRLRIVRNHAVLTRRIVGGVLLAAALVIGLGATDGLQRNVPGYTDALQSRIESNATAGDALAKVTGRRTTASLATCAIATETLQQCGKAPALTKISTWRNTPGNEPLTLAGLKGRVVLIDFWTYSCINCQRTLPHLEAWDRAYRSAGLTIIGVHTPEFAFERVPENVTRAAARLGVRYPIALDNDYGTWNAYGNQYWPAEYLVDTTGSIRHLSFGEGDYGQSERLIRTLLDEARPGVVLPAPTEVRDTTPTEQLTPETYLGYERMANTSQQLIKANEPTVYRLPRDIPQDGFAFSGTWTVGAQAVTAGDDAAIQLKYQATKVFLVLGGEGSVDVSVNGTHTSTVKVRDEPTLYTLVSAQKWDAGTLSLKFSPGVQAYAFTFG